MQLTYFLHFVLAQVSLALGNTLNAILRNLSQKVCYIYPSRPGSSIIYRATNRISPCVHQDSAFCSGF